MNADKLVSVVIPAYNGAATIDETLRSVRSQTHRALEIIVVDDGSRDETADIVRTHAAADPRVRLIETANGGVAAARNRGWQEAASDLIAFVDADDLWSPAKIERQLAVLEASGPEYGLVYCWYAEIDRDSRVTDFPNRPTFHGDVLEQLFRGNFVGNGSAALVRRQALIAARGFESGLWQAGAQGCEDILFYLRVAEHHKFAVVPDFLVGYRYLPDNMSSDMRRMIRSWLLVVHEMLQGHPGKRPIILEGLNAYGGWLARKAVYRKEFRQLVRVIRLLFEHHPHVALKILLRDLPKAGFNLVWAAARHIRWRLRRWRRRGTAAAAPPPYVFCIGNPAS